MSEATVTATDSAIATKKDLAALRDMVLALHEETGGENGDVVPTEDFVLSVMDQILSAETEEEVFELQESGSISGKDFTDTPFRLHATNLTFQRAQENYIQAGAFPYYARLTVREIGTGEEVVINTGAKTLVAALYSLRRLGSLNRPQDNGEGRPLVIKGHPSANGSWLSLSTYTMPTPKSRGKASV